MGHLPFPGWRRKRSGLGVGRSGVGGKGWEGIVRIGGGSLQLGCKIGELKQTKATAVNSSRHECTLHYPNESATCFSDICMIVSL